MGLFVALLCVLSIHSIICDGENSSTASSAKLVKPIYTLKFSPHTFKEGKAYCESLGASLASIRTAEEQAFIAHFLVNNLKVKNDVWLGGIRSEKDKASFEWLNGKPFTYTNWYPGQPNNRSGQKTQEDCVEMYTAHGWGRSQPGTWNDVPCDRKLPVLCKKYVDVEKKRPDESKTSEVIIIKSLDKALVTQSSEETAPTPSSEQSPEFETPQGRRHTFIVDKTPRDFEKSKKFCESQGYSMASIEDQVQQDFVKDILKKDENVEDNVWLGGHRSEKDINTFEWTDGDPFDYAHWASGEPNNNSGQWDENLKNELCVQMFTDAHGNKEPWTWNDVPCSLELPVICKKTQLLEDELKESNSEDTPPTSNNSIDGETSEATGKRSVRIKQLFALDTTPRDFEESKKFCESKGQNMASIKNKAQQDFVEEHITKYIMKVKDNVWLGGRRSKKDANSFEWLNGDAFEYTHWARNEPNDQKDLCVQMFTPHKHRHGLYHAHVRDQPWRWDDVACDKKLPVLCKNAVLEDTLSPEQNKEGKQSKATFTLHRTPRDFEESKMFCESKGQSMASIIDKMQQENLLKFLTKAKVTADIWIGGQRSAKNASVFEWPSGDPFKYTNWYPGEPNNKSGLSNNAPENCVKMYTERPEGRDQPGTWNDVPCDIKLPFICKKLEAVHKE